MDSIFIINCIEKCPPTHHTELSRAEASMEMHFTTLGHECVMESK